MRAFLLVLVLAFTSALPGAARAMLPETGWYWNPAESGRGFNIEVQDNKLFAAVFAYEPGGAAAWYVSGGQMSTDRSYTGALYQTSDGQCIGCAYTGSPNLIPRGNIVITFTSPETAVITALGVSMSVQRHDFSETNLFTPTALFGEWSTTEGDPALPVYFGDRLIFNQTYVASDGLQYGTGYRTGNTARTTLGRCERRSLCVVAFSFSSTSDEYYTFSFHGFGRMEGLLQIVPRGGTPSPNGGFYFLATRTKSKAYVQGFNAPAMSKSATVTDDAAWQAIAAAKTSLPDERGARAKEIAESLAAEGAATLQRQVASELARIRANTVR